MASSTPTIVVGATATGGTPPGTGTTPPKSGNQIASPNPSSNQRTLWPSGVSPVVISATTSPPRSPQIPSRSLAPAVPSSSSSSSTNNNAPSGIASSLASASASAASSSLDGQVWTWVTRSFMGAQPTPRAGHSLTTINQGTALCIYGGQGLSSLSHDTIYLVDGTSLESVCLSAVEKAERRIGHTALDLYNHLYVFGGWNAKKYLDHGCLLDIEHEHLLIEQDATPARRLPPPRRDHTLTRIGRQMYLFGGWNCADQFNDIWILDRSRGQWQWQETTATGPQPSARRGHSATRVGTRIFIWGGLYGYTKFLSDLWVLDISTMEWSQPKLEGVGPSPRAWHSAVAIGSTGKIIFFGGTAGRSKFSNEIFILDTVIMKWQRVTISGTPPSPRCSHAAAMIGSTMYVYGGFTVGGNDKKVQPTGDIFSIDTHIENIWEEEPEPSLPRDEAPKVEQRTASHSVSSNSGTPLSSSSASSSSTPAATTSTSSIAAAASTAPAHSQPMMMAINAVMNANKTTITSQTGATIKTVKKAKGISDVFDMDEKSGGPSSAKKSVESKEMKGTLESKTPLPAGGDEMVEEIEGWLAMQVAPDEQWYTRYFRLLGTDLIAYEEKEKGSLLLQDGVIKRWVNKREQKSHKMEKLVEAVATQKLDKDSYDDILRAIVSIPDAAPMKELVTFMTQGCTEENILFYAGVESFRKITDPAASLAAAVELNNKYVRPGAEFELGSLSTMVRQSAKQQVDKQDIKSDMFDRAQKQIGWTIAVDILPKFLAQFKSKISLLVPADEQFTLKSALAEEDKTVPQCENCMVRFNVTTRRNYCRYCGLVYCNPCVSKLCTLPPQYGVGATRVRVCDMCSNVIAPQPNHVPFSYISRKRGRPLNLAAETEDEANAWITAIETALRTTDPEPIMGTIPLHREGWLMKEDPTSKMYRRRYFILHHNTLWYYEMKVKRAISLTEALLEADLPIAPIVRQSGSKAQGGFAAGLNYAHRFKITCVEVAPQTPATGTRTLSGVNAVQSGTINVVYNLSAPSDEDRVFWRNEINHAIRTQPRIRANLLARGQTAAELAAAARTGGARRAAPTGAATGGTANAATLAEAKAGGGHNRTRSTSGTPTLTTLAEHGSTPPKDGATGVSTATATPAPMSNASMRAILESGAAAAAAALQKSLAASPPTTTTAASPLATAATTTPATTTPTTTINTNTPTSPPSLSIQTSSPTVTDRVMQLPPSQGTSLRSVYVFALLSPSRKMMSGQDQILCRAALYMNESLIKFNGFEIRVPAGGLSPSGNSGSGATPATRPHSMSLANMGPASAASAAQQYFNAGIALQFSTVAAAIHWCVKVQARVATLQWKAAVGGDGKEEKKATPAPTATTSSTDDGPRLCLGIHVHTRSLSMDGLHDGELHGDEDDDDDGKYHTLTSLSSPTGATSTLGSNTKETKAPASGDGSSPTGGNANSIGGRASRGLRMAHRLARTAEAGQTLCSREVWRLWGQTIENREIRRSRVEARESGDVAHTTRGDTKEDDEDDDDDDVDSDDDTTPPNASGATTPAAAVGLTPSSSNVGSLLSSSSSSSLIPSGSGVMIGINTNAPSSSTPGSTPSQTPKARKPKKAGAKGSKRGHGHDHHHDHEPTGDELTALVGEEDEDYGIHLTELDAVTIGGMNEPIVLYEVSSITQG